MPVMPLGACKPGKVGQRCSATHNSLGISAHSHGIASAMRTAPLPVLPKLSMRGVGLHP